MTGHSARPGDGVSEAKPKKVRLPYLPFYTGDFLRSTAGWTLMEQAVYWKLLCASWESGPLPASMSRLTAIVGGGIQQVEFESIWGSVVGTKFEQTEQGLVNLRLEAHRQKYLDFRARQSEGGREGAKKRWRKKKANNVVPIAGHDKVVV